MASERIPYGPAINDALRDPKSKTEDLIALRGRAQATIKAQGDLQAALKKLDREIKRRQNYK
jgi:hypothetical protein